LTLEKRRNDYMALVKREYTDKETVITAQNLNDIQDAIIDLEQAVESGSPSGGTSVASNVYVLRNGETLEDVPDAIDVVIDPNGIGEDTGGGTGGTGDAVGITHEWNGTILSITSASGTTSADLKGDRGTKGDTGVGITKAYQSIQAMGSTLGDPNVFTFELSDGRVSTFTVYNGGKGKDGARGAEGCSVFLWDSSKGFVKVDDEGYNIYNYAGLTLPENRNVQAGDILLDRDGKVYLVEFSTTVVFAPVFQHRAYIPAILTSDFYGDELPAAGTPGRIFFKKVSG
jgi:hypothetical protein